MNAYSLELLKNHLQNGVIALDIDSGSGYLCVAMFLMMKSQQSKGIELEHVPELVIKSLNNLSIQFLQLIVKGQANLNYKRRWKIRIQIRRSLSSNICQCSSRNYTQKLIDQLDKGGRMVIPVGKGNQVFQVIDKDENGNLIFKIFQELDMFL
ncbi:unnamed protein product [Paramecium sonneborni]|uniref:Uncharacterized protein n=1 Tax=Paramecium sonneborni TaxID=65129 RepID=A0A8S1N6G6_9CILI|nr:unnamed protein product [Paramecium sonneborni]